MRAIKQQGGIAIVQDPVEATFPSMPSSVLQRIKVDYSVPLREIGPLLAKLSRQPVDENGGKPLNEEVEIEAKIMGQEMAADELIASVERLGNISKLTCPECHGALWEIKDEDLLRYRCHVGHAYSAESLTDGQSTMLEVALWSAVRALEEQMILARRIVQRSRKTNRMRAALVFERRALEAERNSAVIRELLLIDKNDDIGEPVLEDTDKVEVPER